MTVATQSTTKAVNNGMVRWRELDKEGCAQGRLLEQRIEGLEKDIKALEGKRTGSSRPSWGRRCPWPQPA